MILLPLGLLRFWGHVTNKNHYTSTTTVPMATKLIRMVTYLKGLLHKKSNESLFTRSYKITWQTENMSPLLHSAYGHWFWQVGDLSQGTLPVKSHAFWVTWSCEFTWQIKDIIFLLPQSLWPLNLSGGDLSQGLPPIMSNDHLISWFC